MDAKEKVEAYYSKEGPFKEGIALLRNLAVTTELEETYKWNFPVYTINKKNVLGICCFKNHFGVWFFNGAFLKDVNKVLENAQEGKTKAMRHWKFTSMDDIDSKKVLAYIREAIINQKKGIEHEPQRKEKVKIPMLLKIALEEKPGLKIDFEALSPYKQKEYYEYISEAKQEKTKLSRLEKIVPMIKQGIGLNDKYR
ncbi:MAG: DUF1801 domain-containing protein [Bacteroidota bacterium]